MRYLALTIAFFLSVSGLPFHIEAESDLDGTNPSVQPDLTLNRGLTGTGPVFIENLGQITDRSVLFYTEGDPAIMVRRDSVSLMFSGLRSSGNNLEGVLRMELLGSSASTVLGLDRSGTVHNFYLSSEESSWIELACSYERIVLTDIYPGISMVILLESGWPKYEFHCLPGSDPGSVKVSYGGVSLLKGNDGTMLEMDMGGTRLTEGPLVAYQDQNGIGCRYAVDGSTVTFKLGPYDRSRTLIIDPLIKASTYVGGNSWDRNGKLERGPQGDVYLVGNVESYDLYTHPGSQDRTHGGERDVYVCRMSADLSSMLFATYLGGTLYDDPADICLDMNGNVIVSGLTNSTDLPTTPTAMDRTYNGGGSDAFMSSFDGQLGTLRFSTYIGGTGMDLSRGTACTSVGEPIMVGSTSSSDLPSTAGAYRTWLSGETDIFLLKLKPDGSSVLNCTYIGSDLWGEQPYALELDGADRPVIAGNVISGDYPTTEGAFQRQFGFYMGFVTKFSSDLGSLVYSTFFGNGTWIRDIELDGTGNVYMTGRTVNGGGHFPATPGAFDTSFTGEEDAFIARLSWNGTKVDFASFLGADENYGGVPNFDYYEGGLQVSLLDDGRPSVCGYTDSTFFPMSADAFDRTRNEQDAFLTIFSADCSAVEYSTFLGGRDEDSGTSVMFSPPNILYISGETYSNYPAHDFPVTAGAFDTTFAVGYDLFIASFKVDSFLPGPPFGLSAEWGNASIDLSWKPPQSDGGEQVRGYRVYRGTSPGSKKLVFETPSNLSFPDSNLTNGLRYYYTVKAFNIVGEGKGADVSAVPLKIPGPPTPYRVVPGNGFLNATFTPPIDRGGATKLTYNVYLSNGSGPFYMVASNVSQTYFNASRLTNGISYNLSISASNLAGEGPRSAPFGGVPRKIPSAPRDLLVLPRDQGAVLSWSPPIDDGGAWNLTYRVYGGIDIASLSLLREDLTTTGTELSSLENGRTYLLMVVAVNEMGEGPPVGPSPTNPLGVPSEPWNLTATEGPHHVDLEWDAPNASGGYLNLTYEVRVLWNDGGSLRSLKGSYDRNLTVSGLDQGVPYTFSVRAFNTRFYGPWSTNITVIIYNLPGPPTDLRLEKGDDMLNLTWRGPMDDGGYPSLLYEVYFGEKNESVYFSTNTSGLYHLFIGLRNGKTYFFMVRARNIKGPGPFSDMVSGTPMKVPSRPETLRCTIGDRSLNISWERPGDDGGDPVLTYNVLFGTKGSVLATIRQGTEANSLLIGDLVNGLEYEATVLAVNSMGVSPPATIYGTPMTVPGNPVSLNATWEGITIIVRWLPPESDGGGAIWIYHIYRGEETGSMKNVMKIDSSARSWTDMDVVPGRTYYYSIRAENPLGLGPAAGPVKAVEPVEPSDEKEIPWAFIGIGALMILLVAFIVVMFVLSRNERRRDWEE